MTSLADQLPGAGNWNWMTPQALLGISPAYASKAAGAGTPPTTLSGGDHAAVPWHPDSPTFWLLVIAGATVFGIAGASVRVRAFHAHAGASVGDVT
jgi:hypothetical protein